VEQAALAHFEFVWVHQFVDGNGQLRRTGFADGWQGHHLPPRDVMNFPAKVATTLPDLLPQLQMVRCLGPLFDSTVVQDRWLRSLANHWVK
jgi:hypothetical protein